MTTETIALYTTVCPVSEATQTAAPVTTEASQPWTTSTVYTTRVYTITSCAPDVTNCPANQVTTETIPLYTTVCPVTATATGTPVGPGSVEFPQNTDIGQPSGGAPVVEAAYPTGPSSIQTLAKPTTSVGAPQGPYGGSSVATSSPSKPAYPVGSGSPSYPSSGPGNASPSGSPSGSWSGVPVGPSTIPSIPGTSGASMMSASLLGLVMAVAAHVFVL